MNEQIKQIAERLRGLREVLELTPEEVAASCQMPVENYLEMESGNKHLVHIFEEGCWLRRVFDVESKPSHL